MFNALSYALPPVQWTLELAKFIAEFLDRLFPPFGVLEFFDDRILETMANDAPWKAGNHCVSGHILMYDCIGTDYGSVANFVHAGKDNGVVTNPNVVPDFELSSRQQVLFGVSEGRIEEKCVLGLQVHGVIRIESRHAVGYFAIAANRGPWWLAGEIMGGEAASVGVHADVEVVAFLEDLAKGHAAQFAAFESSRDSKY